MATYLGEASTKSTSLSFTEEMKGYVAEGETDFQQGYEKGQVANTFIVTHLIISTDDVKRFATDPAHEANPSGYVFCNLYGGQLPVYGGEFNLFVDTVNPWVKRMNYRLYFGTSDVNYTLSGFKAMTDNPKYGIWSNCESLYAKVYRGRVPPEDEATAETLAAGIINLYKWDFLKFNVVTFRVKGPNFFDSLRGFRQFSKFFLGVLWKFQVVKFTGR
jgi:cholesterol oxidase